MVLKKSKFGSNTGNTLRRVNGLSSKGSQKCMRTASFITKEYTNTKYTTNQRFPYNLIPTNNHEDLWLESRIKDKVHENKKNCSTKVSFSLNKRKGWLLPEQLKDEIAQEAWFGNQKEIGSKKGRKKKENVIPARPKVVLVEKVLHASCQSNVKECSSSAADWRRKGQRFHPRKCLNGSLADEGHITYTVETAVNENWRYHTESKAKRFNSKGKYHQARKPSKNQHTYFTDDNEDDNEDTTNDEEEEVEFEYEDNVNKELIQNTFCLYFNQQLELKILEDDQEHYDFAHDSDVEVHEICSMNQDQIECENDDVDNEEGYELVELPHHINDTGKPFCEEADIGRCSIDDVIFLANIDDRRVSILHKKIHCFVDNEQITKESLHICFGKRYAESQCSPRRITIFDQNFLATGKYISINMSLEGSQHSEVDINMYAPSPDYNWNLEMDQNGIVDIHRIVAICFRPDTTSSSSNSDIIPISKTSRPCGTNTYLQRAYKVHADVISMDDVWFDIIQKEKEEEEEYSSLDNSFDVESVCSVCFATEQLTHITPCMHVLCDDCWEEYVKNKLSTSHSSILCPEQGCQQVMGPVTIISFLRYSKAILFVKNCIKFHILRTPSLKMCTSEKCSKVALYKGSRTKTDSGTMQMVPSVNCHSSGTSWCFNCQKRDHWPTSCEVNEKYLSEKTDVLSTHHDSGEPIKNFILYKLCPKCNSPIEKEGGCDHMLCFCGAEFCWLCLNPMIEMDANHLKICVKYVKEYKVSMSALGFFSEPYKARMIHKAADYNVVLYEIEKYKDKWLKRITNPEYNYLNINSFHKAFFLMEDCYRLLLNLCVQTGFTISRYARSRFTRFMKRLDAALDVLSKTIKFTEDYESRLLYYASKGKNIDMADINKSMAGVERILDEMTSVGIVKK